MKESKGKIEFNRHCTHSLTNVSQPKKKTREFVKQMRK